MLPPSTLPSLGQAITVATASTTAVIFKSYFPLPSPHCPAPLGISESVILNIKGDSHGQPVLATIGSHNSLQKSTKL